MDIKLKGSDKLVIGCVYRSPHSTDENNSKLNDMLLNISKRGYSHVMVTGDFNMPSINWKTWSATDNIESKEYKFIECLRDCYWTQNVDEITRARIDSNPSLLDLILCNSEDYVTDIENESPLGKSDHSVLVYNFRCYVERVNYKKEKIFYERGKYDEMRSELSRVDWDEKFSVCRNDVDKQWNIFLSCINTLSEKYIPRKYIFNHNRKGTIPLNKDTIAKIKKKHKLWKKFGQTKDGMVYNEYCRARNAAKSSVTKARREFEKSIAKQIKSNPKKNWQYIKNKSKTKVGIADLLKDPEDPNSGLTKSEDEKAQVLSDFFSSVFVNEPVDNVPTLQTRHADHIMEDIIITKETVMKKLCELNVSKSPGPDSLCSCQW